QVADADDAFLVAREDRVAWVVVVVNGDAHHLAHAHRDGLRQIIQAVVAPARDERDQDLARVPGHTKHRGAQTPAPRLRLPRPDVELDGVVRERVHRAVQRRVRDVALRDRHDLPGVAAPRADADAPLLAATKTELHDVPEV